MSVSTDTQRTYIVDEKLRQEVDVTFETFRFRDLKQRGCSLEPSPHTGVR